MLGVVMERCSWVEKVLVCVCVGEKVKNTTSVVYHRGAVVVSFRIRKVWGEGWLSTLANGEDGEDGSETVDESLWV